MRNECVCVYWVQVCVCFCMLTLCNLGQVQTVDPRDLTEGAGSVEDHHETDRTPRPRGGHIHKHIRCINCYSGIYKDLPPQTKRGKINAGNQKCEQVTLC